LIAAWRIARRPDGDRRAYGIVVIAALVASPMVWPHYLALLFVPIALVSPTLSWLLAHAAARIPVAQTTGRPWVIRSTGDHRGSIGPALALARCSGATGARARRRKPASRVLTLDALVAFSRVTGGSLRRNRDFVFAADRPAAVERRHVVVVDAFPLLVLAITHSPAKAGIVAFARSLPSVLFALPAGLAADRWTAGG